MQQRFEHRPSAGSSVRLPVRATPSPSPMRRGRLPALRCRHLPVDSPERLSGRNASPSGITPSTIMLRTHNAGSWTEISPGVHAHIASGRAANDRAPPAALSDQPVDRIACVTPRSLHR
jgi:hypothetical protein